jgi:hypothetical protein
VAIRYASTARATGKTDGIDELLTAAAGEPTITIRHACSGTTIAI